MTEFQVHPLGQAETILLATDGSAYCEGAVQEAIFFGQACNARIVALYVVSVSSETATAVRAASVEKMKEIRPFFESFKKMAADSGIECETIVKESYQPEKTIVEEARRQKADIIIMGRHGKRGLLQLLVGSMTAKVIGQRFPKVLVVPRNVIISGETVLLATDGSEFSRLVTEETISLAKNCSTLKNIVVISVVKRDSDLENARKIVRDVRKIMEANKIDVNCEYLAEIGSPAELIVERAKERSADMILMGGYGKGLSKLLMGHVTERVIGKAECAVLVLEK
ncbi:MAG TPA: universal stress protein [Thermodesulfobacteriaceae bacterium]|nr:universal stress protein [Thermodesulfobacteriaceae bacterium]